MTGIDMRHSPVPIIGWGPGWLVVDKPSGMSVHNDPGADLCSRVAQYILSHPKVAKSLSYDTRYGLHPVHRLDKLTSGTILLSCQRRIFDFLARQFSQGLVTKRYLALVHGTVAPTSGWGLWKWPLTPKSAGRRNPQGQGRRSPCKTHFRLIKQTRHYSLIECRLATGRTHQIRRHTVLAGHPLVGDRRYGALRACRYLEKNYNFNRLGLHAAGLTLQMPDVEAPQTSVSKGLPDEIEQLMLDDAIDGSMASKRKRGG